MKILKLLFVTSITFLTNDATQLPLILNGIKAIEGQFPWHAALFIPGEGYICGGSLVTQKHILTAAHCLEHADEYIVSLGSIRRSLHSVDFRTKDFVIHEDYNPTFYNNDIGLLTLPELVRISDKILPIKLPFTLTKDLSGQSGTVIGFGETETEYLSEDLKYSSMTIIENVTCKKRNIFFDVEKQLCAVAPSILQGDCFGDSGGSLTVNQNGETVIVGIVSYGIGCLNSPHFPGYYTRVSGFLPWINEKIQDSKLIQFVTKK